MSRTGGVTDDLERMRHEHHRGWKSRSDSLWFSRTGLVIRSQLLSVTWRAGGDAPVCLARDSSGNRLTVVLELLFMRGYPTVAMDVFIRSLYLVATRSCRLLWHYARLKYCGENLFPLRGWRTNPRETFCRLVCSVLQL